MILEGFSRQTQPGSEAGSNRAERFILRCPSTRFTRTQILVVPDVSVRDVLLLLDLQLDLGDGLGGVGVHSDVLTRHQADRQGHVLLVSTAQSQHQMEGGLLFKRMNERKLCNLFPDSRYCYDC